MVARGFSEASMETSSNASVDNDLLFSEAENNDEIPPLESDSDNEDM